ncbi:hypothetical protein GLAREA_05076 [Glarea lozoyensis ATCC 20868]|uniref:Heterokaryon incompatibility domain-containing protein n=1 Tax=Glarea lozoyensis (strain ATCC 20868 / MF5171) TaxID=1116229 RepID=S3DF60_GLAL2|nr:uncharacterized protein GLAREA_05076 [Glarea lozoyensis ATCC 20868]EPE35739.1 hypothetical protein GLAREA_05076 [Glarea lozoyensis ATCC 20868]
MTDAKDSQSSFPNISGYKNQEAAISKLCLDCKALLQRIKDIDNGEQKAPKRRIGRGQVGNSHVPDWVPGTDQKYEDLAPFQNMAEDNSMPHKSDRVELRLSSEEGCVMCAWLLQSLRSRQRRTNQTLLEYWFKRPATAEEQYLFSAVGNRCHGHYFITVRCPAPLPPPLSEVPFGPHDAHIYNTAGERPSAARPRPYGQLRGDELATLIVDVIPDSSGAKDLLSATMSLKQVTPSASTWNLFTTWLQDCNENHLECKRGTLNVRKECLPTRLLDLQENDIVRLVNVENLEWEDNIAVPKYAALSHCWGTIHEPQLNDQTVKAFIEGLRIDDLPKSYRDAVSLSKRIGIPYLWIDSICIKQDSKDDWNRESVKMGSIYMNCYVCIAATAGQDNNSSLLEERTVEFPQPLVYGNLVVQADVDVKETGFAMDGSGQCIRIHTLSEFAIDRAPLNQRSWVLQERTLAPRILHCTSDEFIWECCVGMRSESHTVLTAGGSVVKDVLRELYHAPSFLRDISTLHLHTDSRRRFLERWSELINLFSGAEISFTEDRLPACSAVAQQMQPILGNYIAGLWERYLPSQLLWYHPLSCRVGRGQKHRMRQSSYPSWSWASLDCRVCLPYYYKGYNDNFASAINNIEVNLCGEDNTGPVDGGKIDLIGHLSPIYQSAAFGYLLSREALPDNPNITINWQFDDRDVYQADGNSEMKHKAMQPANEEEKRIMRFGSMQHAQLRRTKILAIHNPELTRLCCLPILSHSGRLRNPGVGDGSTVRGLVLEYVEDSKAHYRRIGHFMCDFEHFEDFTRCKVDGAAPMTEEWPARRRYSEEGGFEFSIV